MSDSRPPSSPVQPSSNKQFTSRCFRRLVVSHVSVGAYESQLTLNCLRHLSSTVELPVQAPPGLHALIPAYGRKTRVVELAKNVTGQ